MRETGSSSGLWATLRHDDDCLENLFAKGLYVRMMNFFSVKKMNQVLQCLFAALTSWIFALTHLWKSAGVKTELPMGDPDAQSSTAHGKLQARLKVSVLQHTIKINNFLLHMYTHVLGRWHTQAGRVSEIAWQPAFCFV
jgi:hypothetical protein